MRITIDQANIGKVIQNVEDLKKVVSVPTIECIVSLCNNKNNSYSKTSFSEHLPESWLSDELFTQLIDNFTNRDEIYKTVKRFVEFRRLPKLTEAQKLKIIDYSEDVIRFFPELRYDVWLKYSDGVENSDQVPIAYRTMEMLIKLMANGATIAPDLMTDPLIDSYITINETLRHIPNYHITLERLKKVFSQRSHDEPLDKEQMEGIVVDEEFADMLSGRANNFEFIPDVYRTRDRLSTIITNESKGRSFFWNTDVPPFLKKKGWLTIKFYLEVLAKSGDNGVEAIININKELKPNYSTPSALDMVALVKAYPGAIKYVNKTDQTKAMADAVLGSERAMELKDFLSMKFITKKNVPLFLSSENKDVVNKVERVLTGTPKKAPEPLYTIDHGKEVELELSDSEVLHLKTSGILFIS